MRVAFIGNGGIARAAREVLGSDFAEYVSLVRPGSANGPCEVDSIEALLARDVDIVVECAGHEAVRAYAVSILRASIPLMIVSVGALADENLERSIEAARQSGGAPLVLPAGAVGGIDALAAARLGGLSWVRYRGRKPASAWQGTPAGDRLRLDSLSEAASFFRGTAREAALLFPRNSNVAATVAIAGLGFDCTQVELVADPRSTRNVHEISFEGSDGICRFEIEGVPSPDNPKTSMLTAHSVARRLIEFARTER